MKMPSAFLLLVLVLPVALGGQRIVPAEEPTLNAHAFIFSGRPDPSSWKITEKGRLEPIRSALAKLEKTEAPLPPGEPPYFQSVELINRDAAGLPDRIDTLPRLVRVQRGDRVEWYAGRIEWIDALQATLPDSTPANDRAAIEWFFKRCREACRQDGEKEEPADR